MAVAVDSEMPSNQSSHGAAGATSLTFAFTNTAGTAIVVKAHTTHSSAGKSITSVTYNGVGLTKIVEKASASEASPRNYVGLWMLSSGVATGSNNVVITASGVCDGIFGDAITVTGESGSTGVTNTNFEDSGTTSHSLTLTGTTSGSLALFAAACGSSISTRSQTLSGARNFSNTYPGDNGTMDRAAGGGNITDSWTSSASDLWTSAGMEILATGSGPGAGADNLSSGMTESSANLIRVTVPEETP